MTDNFLAALVHLRGVGECSEIENDHTGNNREHCEEKKRYELSTEWMKFSTNGLIVCIPMLAVAELLNVCNLDNWF